MPCQFMIPGAMIFCPRAGLEARDIPLPNAGSIHVFLCRIHRQCVDDILWAERKRQALADTPVSPAMVAEAKRQVAQQTKGGH